MNPLPSKEFFMWLDAQLREKGWSDRQFAAIAGISQSVISKARTGIQGIGWDASVSMARALNLPPEEILYRIGLLPKPSGYTLGQSEWDDLYERLTKEDREELLAMARLKVERRRGKK